MMVNLWATCSKCSSKTLIVGAIFLLLGFAECLKFSIEPQSAEILVGKELSLTCEAQTDSGRPITYSWERNGRPFKTNSRKIVREEGGQSVLTLSRVEKSDKGVYTCLAEDSEKIESQEARVVVYSICQSPEVTLVSPELISKGDKVILKCRCSYLPVGSSTIQWIKDTIVLQEDDNHHRMENNKLIISTIAESDNGKYGCSVTNKFTTVASSDQDSFNLEITPGSPAKITSGPKDVIVVRRDSAMLDCEFTGDPLPKIKWMFDGQKVKDDANHIALLPNGSLSFLQVLSSDEGTYTCSVSNKFNDVAENAEVQIASISKIGDMEDYLVMKGELAHLECVRPAGVPTPQLKWTLPNDAPLPNDGRYSTDCEKNLSVCKLTINKTKMEDTGSFTCVAFNGMAKPRSKTVSLTVSVPPNIYNPPKDKVVIEGEFVELVCQASGIPKPKVEWHKEGSENNSRVDLKSPVVVHSNGSLIIKKARVKDTGKYYCSAVTQSGWFQDKQAKLSVREKIKVSPLQQTSRMFDAGKDARILCLFKGEAPITVTWSKDKSRKFPKRVKANNETLTIKGISAADNGIYKCKARNDFSKAETVVNVTVVIFPKFNILPANMSVKETESVWFHCNASGDPKPVISWSREKQGGDKLDKKRFILHKNGSMEIKDVQSEDEGNYYCIAGNVAHLAQVTVRLDVLDNTEVVAAKQSTSMARTIGIAVGCAAAYIVLVVGLMIYCKGRRVQYARKKSVINGTLTQGENKGEEEIALNHLNAVYKRRGSYDKWQFPRHDLEALCTLGNGVYGRCFMAKAGGIKDGENETTVIVKALIGKEELVKDEFMHEMDMMCRVQHENIVQLLGLCKEEEPYYIIAETLDKGDLKSFMQTSNSNGRSTVLNASQKLALCSQIAAGMNYLSAHEYIHKDLAARNILISKDLQIKIGFMSLNLDTHRADYYLFDNVLIPLRWMPSEVIFEKEFSDKSDVWSFGVVMWEVFAHGKTPYEERSDDEVLKCIRSDDLKLTQPDHCAPDVFAIMNKCWEIDPGSRPSFGELANALADMNRDSNV